MTKAELSCASHTDTHTDRQDSLVPGASHTEGLVGEELDVSKVERAASVGTLAFRCWRSKKLHFKNIQLHQLLKPTNDGLPVLEQCNVCVVDINKSPSLQLIVVWLSLRRAPPQLGGALPQLLLLRLFQLLLPVQQLVRVHLQMVGQCYNR